MSPSDWFNPSLIPFTHLQMMIGVVW